MQHQVVAPAGSALIFTEALLHATGQIRTDTERCIMIAGYVRLLACLLLSIIHATAPHPTATITALVLLLAQVRDNIFSLEVPGEPPP
jgi:hypothetical protein